MLLIDIFCDKQYLFDKNRKTLTLDANLILGSFFWLFMQSLQKLLLFLQTLNIYF